MKITQSFPQVFETDRKTHHAWLHVSRFRNYNYTLQMTKLVIGRYHFKALFQTLCSLFNLISLAKGKKYSMSYAKALNV